jgi:hypothetical protein
MVHELGDQTIDLRIPIGRTERQAFSHLLQRELHFDRRRRQLPRAQQRRRVKPLRRTDRCGVYRIFSVISRVQHGHLAHTCACDVEDESQRVHQRLYKAFVQRVILQRFVKRIANRIEVTIYSLTELDGTAHRVT